MYYWIAVWQPIDDVGIEPAIMKAIDIHYLRPQVVIEAAADYLFFTESSS